MSRKFDLDRQPPIIVGGVGGSGTRVVAKMLAETGVYMGSLRNEAEDNLWFQLLLKRPEWQARHATAAEKIRGLKLVRDANLGHLAQSPLGYWFVVRAVIERQTTRHKHLPPAAFDQKQRTDTSKEIRYAEQGGSSLIHKARRLLSGREPPDEREPWRYWGWKEPASFLYLPYFAGSFGDFRYIHVMRHGLDMAFSQNQSQLLNYGEMFSVDPGNNAGSLRSASLKYWMAANEWVRDVMREDRNPARCYVLKLEELVSDTRKTINNLYGFLDISLEYGTTERLAGLVRPPGSIGRYKEHDCSVFDDRDMARLHRFGYSV